ncbi:MAG: hypothetical protein PHT99_06185 [Methanoregula sp.]|nr:hypothetical protein [Methanoregula sp.]
MIFPHDRQVPEYGVSESIGFLLIFTIVIVGIGLVTLYGYPMLVKQQVSADEQIMEKNMIVLQNDVKSLAYKTVPYKETALKIGGGSLAVYNTSSTPATSTIRIYDNAGNIYENGFSSGDLRYESVNAETDISLQNGAVVMRDRIRGGSVMLAEPRWFYDSTAKTLVINLIAINSTERISRAGIGTVQMVLGESNYTYVQNVGTVGVDYTPDINADYSTAWNTYITKTLGVAPTHSGNTYSYSVNGPISLAIKKYEVIIKSV